MKITPFRYDDPEVIAVRAALPGRGINYNLDAIAAVLNAFFEHHNLFPEQRKEWQ